MSTTLRVETRSFQKKRPLACPFPCRVHAWGRQALPPDWGLHEVDAIAPTMPDDTSASDGLRSPPANARRHVATNSNGSCCVGLPSHVRTAVRCPLVARTFSAGRVPTLPSTRPSIRSTTLRQARPMTRQRRTGCARPRRARDTALLWETDASCCVEPPSTPRDGSETYADAMPSVARYVFAGRVPTLPPDQDLDRSARLRQPCPMTRQRRRRPLQLRHAPKRA